MLLTTPLLKRRGGEELYQQTTEVSKQTKKTGTVSIPPTPKELLTAK